MLQRTVTKKKSLLPKRVNSTITLFTNRYGAILRRNWITGGASHRRSSSLVAPASGRAPVRAGPAAYGPSAGEGYAGRTGGGGAAAGAIADGRRVGITSRRSSAATSADAVGNRLLGSFSSSIITDRARSGG